MSQQPSTGSAILDRAIEQMNVMFDVADARKKRIDADPRIVRLRAMRTLKPAECFEDMVAHMTDGSLQRDRRIVCLIWARIAQLDEMTHIARRHLADAAKLVPVHEGRTNTVLIQGEAA